MKRFIIIVLSIFITAEIVMAGACLHNVVITKVYDGDTVRGIVNGQEVSIRLTGIDCYETSKINRAYKQAYINKISIEEVVRNGRKSKQVLANFLKTHPNITVRFTDEDVRYNRKVGVLYAGNINVNKYMIQNGGCLMYEYKK